MGVFNGNPRPSAEELNDFPFVEEGYTPLTGDGTVIPLIYGKDTANGIVFAQKIFDGKLYVGVGWCLGEIRSVHRVFINDAAPPSGVTVRHYRGKIDQVPDSWLQAAITDYEDDLVLRLPGGTIGVAYSVFKINASALDGAPRFQAIIKGKIVNNPDAAANTDPFYDNNVVDVDFQSGGTDSSQYARTIAVKGDATVDSGGLQLTGAANYPRDMVGTAEWELIGGASLGTSTKKAGTAALATSSTGDAMVSDVAVIPASTDFTIDMFINPTNLSGSVGGSDKDYLLSVSDTSGDELEFYIKGHKLAFAFDGTESVGTTTISTATWSHVRLVRTGDDFSISLEGTEEASATHASASIQISRVCVAALDDGSYTDVLDGFIDDLLITPWADETDSYTAPTAPLGGKEDPLFGDNAVLAQCDGTDGDTTMSDVIPGITWTLTGATLEDTQTKFGATSLEVDSGTKRATFPATSLPTFSTNALTIDFWYYPLNTGSAYGRLFQTADADVFTGISLSLNNTDKTSLLLNLDTTGVTPWDLSLATPTAALTMNAWNHVAVTVDPDTGTANIYVDGTREATTAWTAAIFNPTSGNCTVGGQSTPTRSCGGYIAHFRLATGTAPRYTGASYTVPTFAPPEFTAYLAELHLDTAYAHAATADDSVMEPLGQEMSLELVAKADSVAAGTSTLVSKSTDSVYSIRVQRDGSTLKLYLSSDGSTWDIANGTDCGTITTSKFYLTVERVGDEYIAMLNGTEEARVYSADPIFDSGIDWMLGAHDMLDGWDGIVYAWRMMLGEVRYGSDHENLQTPFADSGTYGARDVYSTNPALCWADMATSDLYGLGATTDGLSEAAAWCDQALNTPNAGKRCEIGLTIGSPSRTEYWLDILASYANCVWFPEGSNLRIQVDQVSNATNPSGQEIVVNGIFDTASDWTLGTGWILFLGVAICDGTQTAASSLTQTLVTEDAVKYVISVELNSRTAGSITVEFDGVEVIATQSTPNTYTAEVTASGTSNDIEIIADSDFVGSVDNVSVKRAYWLETKWLRGSLSVSGPSDRGSPSSVVVRYTKSSNKNPNWESAAAKRTKALASGGFIPFIQTELDMPGVHDEDEALNKAVQRLQRMHERVEVEYTTTDHAVIHRIGDVIQVQRSERGVDVSMWVESITMIDYGRYRVKGILYSTLHFTNSTELTIPEHNAYFEAQLGLGPSGMWVLDDVPSLQLSYTDYSGRGNPLALSLGTGGNNPAGGEASLIDDNRYSMKFNGPPITGVEHLDVPESSFDTSYGIAHGLHFTTMIAVKGLSPNRPTFGFFDWYLSGGSALDNYFYLNGDGSMRLHIRQNTPQSDETSPAGLVPDDGEAHVIILEFKNGDWCNVYVDFALAWTVFIGGSQPSDTGLSRAFYFNRNVQAHCQYYWQRRGGITAAELETLKAAWLRNINS